MLVYFRWSVAVKRSLTLRSIQHHHNHSNQHHLKTSAANFPARKSFFHTSSTSLKAADDDHHDAGQNKKTSSSSSSSPSKNKTVQNDSSRAKPTSEKRRQMLKAKFAKLDLISLEKFAASSQKVEVKSEEAQKAARSSSSSSFRDDPKIDDEHKNEERVVLDKRQRDLESRIERIEEAIKQVVASRSGLEDDKRVKKTSNESKENIGDLFFSPFSSLQTNKLFKIFLLLLLDFQKKIEYLKSEISDLKSNELSKENEINEKSDLARKTRTIESNEPEKSTKKIISTLDETSSENGRFFLLLLKPNETIFFNAA